MAKVHLESSCILAIPLETYDEKFLFIVNGKEFRTSRIVSDLLSPVICRKHSSDPTLDSFIINTNCQGDFSLVLKLVNFNDIQIPDEEIPFFSEVIEQLGNESIKFQFNKEINMENIFTLINQDHINSIFYINQLSDLINFIALHFSELFENHEEDLMNLPTTKLQAILNNDQIQLKSEDQLLKFVNKLYIKNSMNSILYESVYFENCSTESICQFLSIFDINDITGEVWNRLSTRLEREIKTKTDIKGMNRYKAGDSFKFELNEELNEFNGIINYLNEKSGNSIENEIKITSSSVLSNEAKWQPKNVTIFDNRDLNFYSRDASNSWICFDFKDKSVIPTAYKIRSLSSVYTFSYPKSWVIEGSNDGQSWAVIDNQNQCEFLVGSCVVHAFQIKKEKSEKFRYIRMKMTGKSSHNNDSLTIDSFEIYGELILNKKIE